MLLMYGPLSATWIVDKCNIYSFTSLCEKFPSINLIPPNSLGATSEYNFDLAYLNYILQVDQNFMEFMKIIMDLYYGNNVFLVVNDDPWSQIVNESLLKVIQQRYGINAAKIDTMEDFIYAEETDFCSGHGLYNIDMDKERFTYLQTVLTAAMNGGNAIINEF